MHVSSDLIPGMMSKDTLFATLQCTLGLGRDESNEMFRHIQRGDQDFIKFSKFILFASVFITEFEICKFFFSKGHLKEYLGTRRDYAHLFKSGKRYKKVDKKDN